MPSSKEPDYGEWSPQHARKEFREGRWPNISCSLVSLPYSKLGVLAIPSSFAGEFEEFCRANSASCPLVYRSRPGEVGAPTLALDSDIRTDMQMYSVFINGELRETISDVSRIPWDNMVSFYMGCSFSFENALAGAGVPIRHWESRTDVPVYLSRVPTLPVGPFSGNTIVSMRPMPRDHIQKAVEVTSLLERIGHGAPIHIGASEWIGIGDIYRDYYNVKPTVRDDDVPVFWACNITSGEVMKEAKIPEVTLGYSEENSNALFISDVRPENYTKAHPSEFSHLHPRVIFISDNPLLASLLSGRALDQLRQLHTSLVTGLTDLLDNHGNEGRESLGSGTAEGNTEVGGFIKGAMRVSHASCVTLNLDLSLDNNLAWPCGQIISIVSLVRCLQALRKSVKINAYRGEKTWQDILRSAFAARMIFQPITVWSEREDAATDHTMEYTEQYGRTGLETEVRISVNDKGLTIHELNLLSSINRAINEPVTCGTVTGEGLVLALLALHSCPIHTRYLRKGTGAFCKPKRDQCTATTQEIENWKARLLSELPQENIKSLVTGQANQRFSEIRTDFLLTLLA